ncbi:LTA synthase family protein [Clostridium carnis]
MLKKFKNRNLLFLIMVVILQLKSMALLGMLRTEGASTIDLKRIYFTSSTFILAHVAIITLICSFIFLFNKKGRYKYFYIVNLIISLLFIADIWYYRSNGTFLSIRHIINIEIFNPIGKSLFNIRPIDLVFIFDLIFIALFKIFYKKYERINNNENNKLKLGYRILKTTLVFLISAIIIGVSHYYIDIKKEWSEYSLFRMSWAPFQTYSDVSPLGYHGFDVTYYFNKNKNLNEEDKKFVENWFNDNKEDIPDNNYKGMYKGKNLIAIQVESLENFVIGKSVNGQEITPTLNKLLNESFYFSNIYEQNNSGTSSDCDLLVNTSVFPIRNGSTFFKYPGAEYNTLQKILNNKGYTTISTHAEVPGNWNWAENHKSFEANKILDISYFNKDEIIGPGLSDESYLNQIANKLKDENQPYYTFIATLTSHGPFEIPEDKKYLNLSKELDENILGAYFQSVRYVDEAIKVFLEDLKNNGQLDNTVIMIYGDHAGVNKFYKDKMANAPLEGDWWNTKYNSIPFIIYNPGTKGEEIKKYGGQVDFLPTIAYLLGIDRKEFENSSMGRVLVNTNKDASLLNNGEILGTPKSENEKTHLTDSFKVADIIIQNGYFKNN